MLATRFAIFEAHVRLFLLLCYFFYTPACWMSEPTRTMGLLGDSERSPFWHGGFYIFY